VISTFDTTDPVQEFNETANIYSLRAEYAKPSELQAFGRPLGWWSTAATRGSSAPTAMRSVHFGGRTGRRLELPVYTDRANSERLRLSAGYLFGPDVRGWSVGLSIQY